MADNENILTRLGKLFQSSIVLRKTNDSWEMDVKGEKEDLTWLIK